MRTTTLLRSWTAAAFLLGPAACITGEVPIGEDEQELLAEPPEMGTPCETFCAAAAVRGCPPTGDCVAICELQRADAPSCDDELDAVLACAPAVLLPDVCAIQRDWHPEPWGSTSGERPCEEDLEDYGICLNRAPKEAPFDLACDPRGASYLPLPDGGLGEATSHMLCSLHWGLEVRLDASCVEGGVCTCSIDGEDVHTCQNLLHAHELTTHETGCCSRYFAEQFGTSLQIRDLF